MAATVTRMAVLRHLIVKVHALGHPPAPSSKNLFRVLRGFSTSPSDEARGTFLDKSEVAKRVVSVIKNFQKVDPSKDDLGLDSLDTVEIIMALEEGFGFEILDNEVDKISSINLAVDFIASHPQAK